MSYPRYPAYKPSGVPWLGEVPEHWEVVALKRQFGIVNGSTPSSDKPEYWDGEITWVTPEDLSKRQSRYVIESRRTISQLGYDNCGTTLVSKGSIVLATRAPIGNPAITGVPLCTNQGCKCLVPTCPLSPEYYHYLLSVSESLLQTLGRGSTFVELGSPDLGKFKVTFPPHSEQAAIAAYLDRETAQIDALIARLEQLVALLQEKRQALISHAVTKGLDPSAPMKESGVEWLGEVPEHWEVDRLKWTVEGCVNGVWGDDPNGTDDIVCIRVADFDREKRRVNGSNLTYRSIGENERRNRSLRRGDLLLEKSGGGDNQPVGCVVLYDLELEAVSSNFVARMRVGTGVDPVFLCYLHRALYEMGINVWSIKQNTGLQNLDSSAYLDEKVALPPPAEQAAIAAYLDRETAQIDALIARLEALAGPVSKSEGLLGERRAALITAAVTGQIDVRGI